MKDAQKAVHKHEKHMHPGKPMTKFSKGGVTQFNLRKFGRNVARVMNQKSKG